MNDGTPLWALQKYGGELTPRKGQIVRFGAPQDVHKRQGSAAVGKIIDEVWADEKINRSLPHKQLLS